MQWNKGDYAGSAPNSTTEGGLPSESTPHLKTEIDALTSDGLPQPACAVRPDLTVLNLRHPERKERTIGGWPNCVC